MNTSVQLLATAQRGLTAAAMAERPAERYAQAHLAALRAAAAVLAARANPISGQSISGQSISGQRSRPRSVWVLLVKVAPQLSEWAQFFAAGSAKRSLAQAGVPVVTAREADDLLRDAQRFYDQTAALLNASGQEFLPATG
ncbi:MAG: SAV_6107 family HEPN domain-containing protein [Candidatus Nanopelagicales bacterium]